MQGPQATAMHQLGALHVFPPIPSLSFFEPSAGPKRASEHLLEKGKGREGVVVAVGHRTLLSPPCPFLLFFFLYPPIHTMNTAAVRGGTAGVQTVNVIVSSP